MAETVKGGNKLRANMQKAQKGMTRELAQAMYTEALMIEQESRRRTPVDTGALRASHETNVPEVNGDTVTVSIQVGGPSAPYAVEVHEKIEVEHRNGQAKFLQSAIEDANPQFLKNVAARMNFEGVAR